MFNNLMEIIGKRKSVRSFTNKKIKDEELDKILYSATLAPSGKNRQPWRFIVAQDKYKEKFLRFMKTQLAILKYQEFNYGSLEISINAMDEAHTLIFLLNPYSFSELDYSRNRLLMDVQSIGAAIEHMLLTATALGIGSLWINDVYLVKNEIQDWLVTSYELVAAISLGFSEKKIFHHNRKNLRDLVEYKR